MEFFTAKIGRPASTKEMLALTNHFLNEENKARPNYEFEYMSGPTWRHGQICVTYRMHKIIEGRKK